MYNFKAKPTIDYIESLEKCGFDFDGINDGDFYVTLPNGLLTVSTLSFFCLQSPRNSKNIIRFDVEEFEAFRGYGVIPGDKYNILDFGYWYINDSGDIGYESPCRE